MIRGFIFHFTDSGKVYVLVLGEAAGVARLNNDAADVI